MQKLDKVAALNWFAKAGLEWVRNGVRYGINFLAESQRSVSADFGGRRVEGIDAPFIWQRETPLLDASLVHIVSPAVDVHPAGDHYLYIGEWRRPLIFYSGKYHQVHTYPPMLTADGCLEGR